MVDNKGTYHITDNNDIYEPARNNNFELIVTGLDGILKSGVDASTANENDYIKNGQEVLRVAIDASSVPHYVLGVIEVKRGNTVAKFADVPTFASQTIRVKDYISIDSGYSNPKDVIMAWQALAYNPRTEQIFRAKNYKKTCTLIEWDPSFRQVVRKWTIEGAWVSEISEDDFSVDSDGQRKFNATIVFDRAYCLNDR